MYDTYTTFLAYKVFFHIVRFNVQEVSKLYLQHQFHSISRNNIYKAIIAFIDFQYYIHLKREIKYLKNRHTRKLFDSCSMQVAEKFYCTVLEAFSKCEFFYTFEKKVAYCGLSRYHLPFRY